MEQSITVYGIVLHPDTTNILVVPATDGWTLPHFTRERWELWSCVNDVNEAMSRQLGISPVTLRCHALDTVDSDDYLVYGIENTDPSWMPPAGSRWASAEEIQAGLLSSYLAETCMQWFAWEACMEPCRVPWYERGWAEQALAWIEQQVVRLGLRLTGPPLQLRTCQRSTVWEIPTTGGRCFFKAVPSFFRYEIPLTQYLATVFPDAIPRVLASEDGCGWMLMANAGNSYFDQSPDLDTWSAMLQHYAEMQVELSRHVDRLTALGCPSFPPAQLGDGLREIMANPEALTPVDAQFQLTEDEKASLREWNQRISTIGQQLTHSPVPLSLDHGDFWTGQILQQAGRHVVIDWSDANITIPFISLFKYLIPDEVKTAFPDNPNVESTLRDAYLHPWKPFASHDQLVELYHQAQAIANLHDALYNYRLLFPRMEVRWEHGNMIPLFLKRLALVLND